MPGPCAKACARRASGSSERLAKVSATGFRAGGSVGVATGHPGGQVGDVVALVVPQVGLHLLRRAALGEAVGVLALGHAGHARFHALPEQRVAGEE